MTAAATAAGAAPLTVQPIVLFYRVRLMLAQMLGVLLTTFCLLGLPPRLGAIIVALLVVGLWTVECRLSIRNPISQISALMALVLVVVRHRWDLQADAIHVPAIFFAVLLLVGGGCLLRRHPASMYYSEDAGTPALHWWTSSIWVAVYAVSLLASLMLPWRPDIFWLIPSGVLAGVAATLWLQFMDMGPTFRRARQGQVGAVRITEIEPHAQALAPFYAHYVREATHSLKQGQNVRRMCFDQLLRLKIESDMPSWPRTRFFSAYDGDTLIGTISCSTCREPGAPLDVESGVDRPVCLDTLSSYGPVLQVARFTIQPAYRQRQDVFRGLLGAVIEYALEHDVAFLVTQAYPNVCPVYTKIGFVTISQDIVRARDTGTPLVLMAFNLARRVVCERSNEPGTFRLDGALNSYLTERYFKRQSLRSMLWSRRPWALDEVALIQVCLEKPTVANEGALRHEL